MSDPESVRASQESAWETHAQALSPQGSRNESAVEKLDRNWMELIQELRVLQTGVQILGGFLLTLPFQARFHGGGPAPKLHRK